MNVSYWAIWTRENASAKERAGSLQWAYMAIARLGGLFMDSKRTGITSWGALWEGWEALQSKLDGFLAKDLMAQGSRSDQETVGCHLSAEGNPGALWSVKILPWTLDIAFGEDQLQARAGFAGENLAVIRRWILNMLKQNRT